MPENRDHQPEENQNWDNEYEEREKKLKRKRIIWFVTGATLLVAALSSYDIYNVYLEKKVSNPSLTMQKVSTAGRDAQTKAMCDQILREAELKSAEGRPEEAKQILLKYLSRDPQNAEVHYAISKIFLRQGQIQGAFNYMYQAALLKPGFTDAGFQLANIYLIDKNLNAAGKEAKKLRESNAVWQALLIESQISLGEKKLDEAILKAQEAEARYGRPLEARWAVYLADLQLRKGNRTAATQTVRKAESNAAAAEDLISLAKFYVLLKDDEKSLALFQDALKRYPRNLDILYTYGDYLFSKGNFSEALNYYRRTLELAPDAPVLYYNIGRVFLAAGRLIELKQQIDFMLAKDGQDLFALRLKVQYELATGKRLQAIETMNAIVGVLPLSPVPQLLLAGLYLQEGQLSLAAASAQKAVSLGDRSISPQIILANVYGKRGQLAEAKKSLDVILAADPNNLPALLQSGDTLVSMGIYKEAEEKYAKAAALYPRMPALKARTAWLKAVQGNPAEALSASRRYWQEMPEDFNALGAYINALVVNNRTDEAIAVVRNQAMQRKKDWRPFFLLGDLYLTNGNRREALSSYQRAFELDPENVDLILNICSRYSRARFHAEMEVMLIAARAKNPSNPLLTNQLAWLYVENLGSLNKAKLLVDSLYREAKDAPILDTVGWYCYKVRDYKNAAYYLGKATRLDPENRVIKEHLAMAMHHIKTQP